MKRNHKPRLCQHCDETFKPTSPFQKYCGSQQVKGTCSFIVKELKVKKWNGANKVWVLKRQTAYNKAHKEQTLETKRRWRKNHPEQNSECQKQWRENNKAKFDLIRKKWADENPERSKARIVRYQHRRRGARGDHSYQEWEAIKKKFNGLCARCLKKRRLTIDHIKPLLSGGTNHARNLQPLCRSCNSWKRVKWIAYYLERTPIKV